MKLFTQSLVTLPVAAGMLMASSPAIAGILTPPPPDSSANGSPTSSIGGSVSGVTVCVIDVGGGDEVVALNFFPPPIGATPPTCAGANTVPGLAGQDEFGIVDINSTLPIVPPSVFAGLLGETELLADFTLPFLGTTPAGGLPLGLTLTPGGDIPFDYPLINADSSDGDLGMIGEHDTFQATVIESVSLFQNAGGNTEASFNFRGKWFVTDPDTGEIEFFHGDLALSQIIAAPISEVLADLRSPGGLVTAFNVNQTIEAKLAPEPSAIMAMAAFGGAGLLARRKRS